jgi:hypothetical protein
MKFRNRMNGVNKTLMSLGLMVIVAGILMLEYLRPSGQFTPALRDGTVGLVYGLAIGILALGLRGKPTQCAREEV